MTPVEAYFDRLHEVHASRRATPELSYRGALENLLAAVGKGLDPEVVVIHELVDAAPAGRISGWRKKEVGQPMACGKLAKR